MKIPAGAGIFIPGTSLDLGDQAPRRRAGRSVVPVLVMPMAVIIAVVIIAAVPLPHDDRPGAVPMPDPAVVVVAVPIVERHGPISPAAPVLRRPVAMDPINCDDPRTLDHHDSARRGTPVGGVPVADDDVAGDRPASHYHTGLDPLSMERNGGGHEPGDQRPSDGAGSHIALELGTG
jgi:hypothetical protein